jgi:NAD(P)-dependent dehydrogenase (short-subunit alcohol dehydrogenase family)
MSHKKIWLITGASRGMGVDFAKAALAAGHAVAASGRDSDRVSKALGSSSFGKPRMASNPATRRSSRERSSSSRAKSHRRAALSPAPMPLLLRSRRSPI